MVLAGLKASQLAMPWIEVKGRISHSDRNGKREGEASQVLCFHNQGRFFAKSSTPVVRCFGMVSCCFSISLEVLTSLLFACSETRILCTDKWGFVSFLVAPLGCTLFGKLQNGGFASCQDQAPGGHFFFQKRMCAFAGKLCV